MAEIEVSSFTKHYRFQQKIEVDGFLKRYIIPGDLKSFNERENKKHNAASVGLSPKIVEEKKEIVKVVEVEKEEKEEKKPKQIKEVKEQKTKKINIDRKEMDELSKYTKINWKKYNVIEDEESEEQVEKEQKVEYKKKKTYKKTVPEEDGRHQRKEKLERNYHKHQKKNEEKRQRQPSFVYDQYLTIEEIEKSRVNGEKKYFKGRVEYGEGPKWRGKIISEQIEGLLFIEGKHRNRTLHDDKIYFSLIHEQNQKSLCTVHYIFPGKRFIVGKVDFLFSKGIYTLQPTNSRITAMNVKAQHTPKNLKKGIATHYYMAQYLGWNKKDDYPECKIVEQFGKFGEIDVETTSLLKTHGLEDKDHDNDIVREDLRKFLERVDEKGQYKITEQQLAKRQDLRKKRIFTIDPLNARDFDDAISVDKVGCNFKVGVHIADASFFVEEGSMVDKQAQRRTTSAYLVHRVIPMLPRVLCQNLCSLNPGCQRLTFTIWIMLNSEGKIVETPTISRSVIHSKARFTYEQAQKIIIGQINSQKEMDDGFGCISEDYFVDVAEDIKLLHNISTQLRNRRVERGALFFEIPKKVFKLDQNKNPIGFEIYERKEAHFLVEQLMILANEQVGEILVRQIGSNSLLRRHKFPGPKKIDRFEQFMTKIGVPLQMSQNTRVQDQVNAVLAKQGLKQSVRDIVKYEMIYLLEAADYFTVGDSEPASWIHYALNSPVYTHFTSPIRRYPDILVHRQLASILDGKKNFKVIPKELTDLCNEKKLQAKRVSNGCEKIFTCLFLRKNEVVSKGIIGQVEDWGIKICVPKFDFKGLLRFKDIKNLKVISVENDTVGRKVLKMEYSGEVSTKFILKELQQVEVKLACKEGFPLDYLLILVMPHPRIPGQHLLIN